MSCIGTSRHFTAHNTGRFRSEADMVQRAKPAGSVESDPSRKRIVRRSRQARAVPQRCARPDSIGGRCRESPHMACHKYDQWGIHGCGAAPLQLTHVSESENGAALSARPQVGLARTRVRSRTRMPDSGWSPAASGSAALSPMRLISVSGNAAVAWRTRRRVTLYPAQCLSE
jgi:hypothetical protein